MVVKRHLSRSPWCFPGRNKNLVVERFVSRANHISLTSGNRLKIRGGAQKGDITENSRQKLYSGQKFCEQNQRSDVHDLEGFGLHTVYLLKFGPRSFIPVCVHFSVARFLS